MNPIRDPLVHCHQLLCSSIHYESQPTKKYAYILKSTSLHRKCPQIGHSKVLHFRQISYQVGKPIALTVTLRWPLHGLLKR